MGLTDTLRSGLVTISSNRDQVGRWFTFAPGVNFERCMPAEQEPMISADR
jgi:hypothetical protein